MMDHIERAESPDMVTDVDDPGPVAPEPHDHKTLCKHGNAFNVCVACLRDAGIPEGEIEARRHGTYARMHGRTHVPPTPRQRPMVDPAAAQRDLIARHVRKATGK